MYKQFEIRCLMFGRISLPKKKKKKENIEHRILKCFYILNLRLFERELVNLFDYEMISIFTQPLRSGRTLDTRSISKRSLTALNSEFSFS